MKNFPHLRSAILLVTVCCFRSSPPVLAQTASAMLDANNVGAPVYANVGFLWNNPAFNGRGLEVPRVTDPNQPRRSTVFSSGLWLGGLDDIGTVYTAAETYRQGNPPLQASGPGRWKPAFHNPAMPLRMLTSGK